MAISLQSISKTLHATPPRILIHGGEKVGKSTFASQCPDVIFLPTEEGLNGIDAQAIYDREAGKKRLETYEEFDQALKVLETQEHSFKAICIDSADWLETLIHNYICRQDGADTIDKAAGGYGRGYVKATGVWHDVLNRLDRLNAKGMTIILICHSKAVAFNDPMHEPYDIWQIKLHTSKSGNGSLEVVKEWADIIGFAAIEKFTSKSQSDETKYRAVESGRRFLHLEGTASFLAGNRYSLPKQCDLNWGAFMQSFQQPNQQTQQES